MRWIRNWRPWLAMVMLQVLASGCCGGSGRVKPAHVPTPPVVAAPSPCSSADRIPQWRVPATRISLSQGTDLETLLWQRIDDLEMYAARVKASCGTPRDPAPSSTLPR